MGGYGGLLPPSYGHPNGTSMAAHTLEEMATYISKRQLPYRPMNLTRQYPNSTAPQIFDDGCSQSSLDNFGPRALAKNHDEETSSKSTFEDIPILYETGTYLPGVIPVNKDTRDEGNGDGWNSDGMNEEWADFDLMEFSNAVLHNDTTFGQGNETLGFGDIGEMDMAALPNYFNMAHQSMTGCEGMEIPVSETEIPEKDSLNQDNTEPQESTFGEALQTMNDREDFQSEVSAPSQRSITLATLPSSHRFHCDTSGCTRSYKRRCDLKRHQRGHSPVRRHECRVIGCHRSEGNGFTRKDHLRQHMKHVHAVSTQT